ncbi:MAG: hypothetical protein VKP70_06140 [Cyanobacteriota bacterium]|nr:hypothetical protein [Cyanobacteriota bacterium]
MHHQVPPPKLATLRRQVAAFLISLSLMLTPLARVSPAWAAAPDVGLTSFYSDAQDQDKKVETLKTLGFDVAVPLNVSELSSLGDGSFTQADLDFTSAVPSIPKTDKRITFQAPLGSNASSRLYAVVAGIPDKGTCPITVQQTKIVFFDNQQAAEQAAKAIAQDGFLVYVTTDSSVQADAKQKIKDLNCQPDGTGVIVNGKTKFVSVDFSNIWPLLPNNLQQAAKRSPFTYQPASGSDAIYLVNARKLES